MARKNNCKKHKKPDFLEALRINGGLIAQACEVVGISYNTYLNWCREDEEFKSQINEIIERKIDYVESKLMQKIDGDDLTAIIFYLKTKGRKRGYGEKQQIEVQEIPSNTYVVDDDEDAKAFAEAEKKGLQVCKRE